MVSFSHEATRQVRLCDLGAVAVRPGEVTAGEKALFHAELLALAVEGGAIDAQGFGGFAEVGALFHDFTSRVFGVFLPCSSRQDTPN